LVPESVDPAARGRGADRASYRTSSARSATPPASGWAAEFGAEPSATGHWSPGDGIEAPTIARFVLTARQDREWGAV